MDPSDNYYDDNVSKFQTLSNNYIDLTISLVEKAESYKLLPSKIIAFVPFIKNYIRTNKLDVINDSVMHQNEIIGFALDEFVGEDDNATINTYKNTVSPFQKNIYGINVNEMLLSIKRRSKRLNKKNYDEIKKLIHKLSCSLASIQELFV